MGGTDDLIARLAHEPASQLPVMARTWLLAVLSAYAIAALIFALAIGPRPDFMEALTEGPRFGFKFVVALALVATTLPLLWRLACPGGGGNAVALGLAPALLLVALCFEMSAFPQSAWFERALGTNALVCLTLIPLLGLAPLGLFLFALSRSAPTRPKMAGLVAGIAAGGIAATLYAAHCPDDSPLFVALWYPGGIAILAGVGAVFGWRFLRW